MKPVLPPLLPQPAFEDSLSKVLSPDTDVRADKKRGQALAASEEAVGRD